MALHSSFTLLVSLNLVVAVVALKVRHEREDCECLPWSYVYEEKGIKCGEANEFYPVLKYSQPDEGTLTYLRDLDKNASYGLCPSIFEINNDEFCVKMNIGDDVGDWCYVDSKCTELNGGSAVRNGTSWKKCDLEKDVALAIRPPEWLSSIANREGFDFMELHKLAYPTSNHLWQDVSGFFNSTIDDVVKNLPDDFPARQEVVRSWLGPMWGDDKKKLSLSLRKEMEKIPPGGMTFYLTADGNPPHVIVALGKVFLAIGRPGKVFCVANCEVPVDEEMVYDDEVFDE